MKVYITKYALTAGITIRNDAEVCTEISADMIACGSDHGINIRTIYHRPHWHETWEAAKKQAEKMRDKKIASLKKQIDRLEKLKFVID